MAARITPMLLAGGAGTRLWPLSRAGCPKQFQPLTGPLSTFQQTLLRVADAGLYETPVVLTHRDFAGIVRRQAQALGMAVEIVIEPERRDSAAAICVAALLVERRQPGGLTLAMACDHAIQDEARFCAAVRRGCRSALAGHITVFGVVPTAAETGYGYIRPGAAFDGEADLHHVDAFVEKPDAGTAERYLRRGYLWNCGNFLFRADAMIAEFARHAGDILDPVRNAVEKAQQQGDVLRLDAASFAAVPKTSLDYAVIEKSDRIAVVKGHFGWSDIGNWDAVWAQADKDAAGNAVHGRGLALQSRGCLIHSTGPVAAVIGADNLVVAVTGDMVLVMPKSCSQQVKTLPATLREAGLVAPGKDRPHDGAASGSGEILARGAGFSVTRLTLPAGESLAVCEEDAASCWLVTRGTARLTRAGADEMFVAGQFMPMPGQGHVFNDGAQALELIRLQASDGTI